MAWRSAPASPFRKPLLALLLALPLHAQALRIEGLRPFDSQVRATATPVVRDGRLLMPLPQGPTLTAAPWPAFLPQTFEEQELEATLQPGPAGPSAKLTMKRVGGGGSWLQMASGARRSTPVIGGWQLKPTARGWWLAQGTKLHFLGKDGGSMQPVQVSAGIERWCVYLLDGSLPQARPGLADEDEAQASWAALKMDTPGARCRKP